jgi:flagellar basal-body rod protein FlgB
MFQNLTIFQTAADMAKHAGARQAVVARNVANADTPGFQAQRIAPFSESYRGGAHSTMKATRAGHLNAAQSTLDARVTNRPAEPSPNGNTVSIEDEMLSAVDVSREHSRALAVYRHALTVLRTTVGR